MSTADIIDAALSLPLRQRGRLLAALIQSLEVKEEPPFANADDAELLRRVTASTSAKRRPNSTVTRAALERLRKRR